MAVRLYHSLIQVKMMKVLTIFIILLLIVYQSHARPYESFEDSDYVESDENDEGRPGTITPFHILTVQNGICPSCPDGYICVRRRCRKIRSSQTKKH